MRKYLLVALLFSSACLASDPFKDLSAEYDIGGATVIDAPAGEPGSTHIYLRIKDEAARDMYDMIESTPVRNACIDDGTLTKWAKNIQCDFSPQQGSYICYFSIDVNANVIGLGEVC